MLGRPRIMILCQIAEISMKKMMDIEMETRLTWWFVGCRVSQDNENLCSDSSAHIILRSTFRALFLEVPIYGIGGSARR